MKAEAGQELACQGRELNFEDNGISARRGVFSYYATNALAHATNVQSWFDMIEAQSSADLATGKITPLYKPVLQVCGDPSVKLL